MEETYGRLNIKSGYRGGLLARDKAETKICKFCVRIYEGSSNWSARENVEGPEILISSSRYREILETSV